MIESNLFLWIILGGVFCFLIYLYLSNKKKEFFDWLETVVVAGGLALVIIVFVAQSFYIPSGSMIPTLEIKDRVIGNKFIYKFREPERQNVVIFINPQDNKTHFVKRLIGLPGERVELRKGTVFINEQPLNEEKYPVQKDWADFGPVLVPPHSFFVLGDNRAHSADSRYWGYVPRKNIVAQGMLIFWPLTHIKIIPQ